MDDATATGVEIPDLADPDLHLAKIDMLQPTDGVLVDFDYVGADLRNLAASDVRLATGRIGRMSADQAVWERVDAAAIVWENCRIGTFRWRESKLSRVVFRGCHLMAASLEALSLSHVLFADCRLDYASFDSLRFTGPAAFVRCNLSEATLHRCNLSGVVFRECEFRGTTFESGTYRRTDLRGNDLSTVRGGHRLDGVIISPSQQAALAHALIAELRPTLASEPDAGPGIGGL